MELNLHANATTAPKTRAYIQRSKRPVAELAAELGVSETTIRRWRSRTTVNDRSHTPKRLKTSLSAMEQALVCELRTELQLPLDDVVEVMRRCVNGKLSRSAIHRCLKRHGLTTTEPGSNASPIARRWKSLPILRNQTPARGRRRTKNPLASPKRLAKHRLPGVLAVAGTSVLAFRKPISLGDHSFQDIRMDCSKGGKPVALEEYGQGPPA
jgi:transposase